MKKLKLSVLLLIFLLFINCIIAHATDIFRLLNPEGGSKTPEDGPPFFRFGNTQQYYYIDYTAEEAERYNDHLNAVTSAFKTWNNAGSVKFFKSSTPYGLKLSTFAYHNENSAGWVNPGTAYTGHINNIINTSSSYIKLNTHHFWQDFQYIEDDIIDVQSILLHEIGHIHGLAHPLPTSYDYINGDPDAPIMAGGDNRYFWDHIARSLRDADINGTQFLQYNAWVPEQCATLETAINNTFKDVTIYFTSGTQTLTQNLTVSTGKTLRIQSGTTLVLNGYKLTTTTGTIIVEAGATITPCIKRMSSNSIKGLHPTIASAIADLSAGQHINLGHGTFTENVSMPSNLFLCGAGMNTTIINGDVTFNNKSNSDIWELTVNGEITVNGGTGIYIQYLKAKDAICINGGSNHQIYEVVLTNSGYIDLWQIDPLVAYITSTNSLYYGVIGTEADFGLEGNEIENKHRAVYCTGNSDVDIDNIDFCSNTWDIYSGANSNVIVWSMGTMSDCPPPFFGDVTFLDDCVDCNPGIPKSSLYTGNNEFIEPLEGADSSPEGLEYAELRNLYRAIQAEIRQDRKDSVKYDISKYAPKYNQVITGMKAFVAKYPVSEYAQHALKFIDYSSRALNQQDDFAAYLTALGKDAKYKSLQTTIKSQFIPYYLGKGEYQTALNLTDEVMKAQTDPENALYYLYRQGVIYHKYLKDAAKAEAIYKQVIDTDPNSAMAFSAGVRLGKLGKVYEGENKPSAEEPEVKFAIRNHPNPFNPVTNIQFDLPEADHVTLKVYDITGREVVTLVDALQGSGSHTIMWNSQDKFGQRVASGMYFYRIEYRGQVLTNKMILMR